MSRTTVLLVGLMLVGLIVSPALAQTTVKFMDQHEGPDHPITPVPTYSNYSFLIQYDLMSPENYWRGSRQHIDEYNGWSTAMPRMDTGELSDQRANLFEFKDMIGSATDMYEETYVGQVPHGAVIISATLWLRRTNWGDATTNLGVYPVLDPDNLGHWGVNTDDPSWDPAGNGYKLGAGWVTRNSYPDGDPDIPWTLTGDQRIDDSVDLAAGTGNDFLGDSMEVKDMPKNTSDTWLVTDSVQNWVDCAGTMQGWMVLAATGDGEIFAGQNDVSPPARPILEITFTASLGGDANKGGVVNVGDLGVLAGNYGTETGLVCWGEGDFSGDGNVNVADLGILAGNYTGGAEAEGTVPEPMTMTLLGLGALALIRRRK